MKLIPKEDCEAVRRLLFQLFPVFAEPADRIYSQDLHSVWRKRLRICSPDIFPIYFRFAISNDVITSAEMKKLLKKANDSTEFGQMLLEYASQPQRDRTTRVRAILERLGDYTREDIPAEDIPPIVDSFFNIGDKLLKKQDEPQGLFDFSNSDRILMILSQLLHRLEENERFQTLKKAIEGGAALSIANRAVVVLGHQHGKFGAEEPSPESEQLVNAEHLKILEQIVLQKIQKAAENDILVTAPGLTGILRSWKAWSDEEEVKAWVAKIAKSDKNLAMLLEQFGRVIKMHSSGNVTPRRYFRLDPKWLEPFIDPDKIIDKAKSLTKRKDLPDSQVSAAKQFVEEYELRQQGDNPNKILKF